MLYFLLTSINVVVRRLWLSNKVLYYKSFWKCPSKLNYWSHIFSGCGGGNLRLLGQVQYIKTPDISRPEANWAIYEVMVMFWLKISSKIRTLEASGPIFLGVLGLGLPGKVQCIKIPDISRPEANWAIHEVMMMLCLKILSKIRTLEASGPNFLGGLGSEPSRQGSIHQNTQHKSSEGQPGNLWSDGEALIENFIQNQNFGGQWPRFFGCLGSETSRQLGQISKYLT